MRGLIFLALIIVNGQMPIRTLETSVREQEEMQALYQEELEISYLVLAFIQLMVKLSNNKTLVLPM